jgi:2,3-bisphosphoglycerate-dependent phosphoglycerate mutase
MNDVVFARHGESETAARGIVGGDATLTAVGRTQARELGRALAVLPVAVCLTSPARRARQTAGIALEGRSVRIEVSPELADIEFGTFEGRPLDDYRDWVAAHRPEESPPGGESRVATLRRFCRAYRKLLGRPEAHVLVVAHGLTLSALAHERPRPIVAGVPYGSTMMVDHARLETAVERIEDWCEAPAW